MCRGIAAAAQGTPTFILTLLVPAAGNLLSGVLLPLYPASQPLGSADGGPTENKTSTSSYPSGTSLGPTAPPACLQVCSCIRSSDAVPSFAMYVEL